MDDTTPEPDAPQEPAEPEPVVSAAGYPNLADAFAAAKTAVEMGWTYRVEPQIHEGRAVHVVTVIVPTGGNDA